MKEEIKYALYMLGMGVTLGFSLIVYAHSQFANKSTVEKMDERLYEVWKEVVKK